MVASAVNNPRKIFNPSPIPAAWVVIVVGDGAIVLVEDMGTAVVVVVECRER